jgi:cytochrome c5
VSKQDTHFFNTFSLVIGLLMAVALCLFAFARVVASHTQDQERMVDARYKKTVDERIAPFAKVAVAGQDNSALAIKAPASSPGAGAAAAMPANGTELVNVACSACHGAGIAGAPKLGDKAAWGARIAKGKDTLYQHAIQGFQGSAGMMPPKGGRVDVPDDLVRAAVDHMIEMSH